MTTSTPQPGASVTTPTQRRIAIALLLFGAVCAGMGQTIVFSVLPPLAREIGLTNFQVGSIFMVSASAYTLLGQRWGRLSDAIGRKPVILIGMLGFTGSMALFGGAVHVGLLGLVSGLPLYLLIIAMRALYGVFGSANPPSAQAYIADRTSKLNRTSGIAGFSAAFGFGAMIGPSFGAVASLISPTAPFYAASALGAVMTCAVFAFLPERTGPAQRKRPARLRLTDQRLTPFFIFAIISSLIYSIPIQTIAFYFIDRLGYSTAQATAHVSVGLTAAALASLIAQLTVVQRLRLPPARLMRAAPALIAAGQAAIFFSDHFWPVVIGMAASGFGSGLALPAATAAASLTVEPDEQGGAIGLAQSAGASGFILSPVIGFSLYSVTPAAPFMFTTCLALALLGFAWKSRKVGEAVPPHADDVPAEATSDTAAAPYQ